MFFSMDIQLTQHCLLRILSLPCGTAVASLSSIRCLWICLSARIYLFYSSPQLFLRWGVCTQDSCLSCSADIWPETGCKLGNFCLWSYSCRLCNLADLHFSLCCSVAQSCSALCDPMDCSLPGFSIHGILQARILEWVAISSSRRSSQCRDQTCISCGSCGPYIGRWILYYWATWKAQKI